MEVPGSIGPNTAIFGSICARHETFTLWPLIRRVDQVGTSKTYLTGLETQVLLYLLSWSPDEVSTEDIAIFLEGKDGRRAVARASLAVRDIKRKLKKIIHTRLDYNTASTFKHYTKYVKV